MYRAYQNGKAVAVANQPNPSWTARGYEVKLASSKAAIARWNKYQAAITHFTEVFERFEALELWRDERTINDRWHALLDMHEQTLNGGVNDSSLDVWKKRFFFEASR